MHFRLQLWMALFALFATAAIGAEPAATPANAPTPAAMPPGQIKAVKVVGSVSYVLNGQTIALHEDDAVPQSATVVTGGKSSVILVFSNGATTQLGDDSSLAIDQFLQDPFSEQVAVAALTAEPTVSHTHLRLNKGELVGNVKHLNHDKGSTFTIDTPVGAAGIRGTTFRIVFRPSGTGQAFAIFSMSTIEGNVAFNGQGQPGQGTPGQGQTPGQNRSGSVAVTTGQEVVVTVTVNTDPKTGQVVVTAPVQLATTTPINPLVRAEIVSQATTMATTVEQSQTTFTSSGTSSGGTSSGTSSSGSSTSSTDSTGKDDKSKDSSGGTSGGDSSGSSSSSTSSTSSSSTSSTSSSSTSDPTSSGSSSSSTSSGSSSSTGSTSGPTSSGGTSVGGASTLSSSVAASHTVNNTPGFTSTPHDLTPGAGG